MLSANVGSLPLGCKNLAAGHVRPGLHADGNGLRSAGSDALRAAFDDAGGGTAVNAMPPCNGARDATSVRSGGIIVPSDNPGR